MENVALQEFVVETELNSNDGVASNKSRGIITNISADRDGKHAKAHSPVEVIIGALGSCFFINIQRYFQEKGEEISNSDVQMILKGYRDPEIPKLVKIDYEVLINKELEFEPNKLKEFMELGSTTYRTLESSVEISGKITRKDLT